MSALSYCGCLRYGLPWVADVFLPHVSYCGVLNNALMPLYMPYHDFFLMLCHGCLIYALMLASYVCPALDFLYIYTTVGLSFLLPIRHLF